MRLPIAVLALLLPAAAQEAARPGSPVPAEEQNFSGSLDLGYRWVSDVGGDLNSYRSVVNLGEGPKMMSLDLLLRDPKRTLFDTLAVAADSWGGDPYNTARLEAERAGTYRLLFDYRNIAYFNYLPSFANPGVRPGLSFTQRAFDLDRKFLNTELELRPGKSVAPFLGYAHDSGSGTGITPFVSNGNEYPVRTNLSDKTDNYRGGVRFDLRRWHVTVEQGGTSFKDDQHIYTDEHNPGNRTSTLLGRTLFLDQLDQSYRLRGQSLYSRALLTARPAEWVDLYGQFLYSRPESDVRYSESAAGLFYLGLTRFYSSGLSLLAGEAKQPHTSGSFSAEIRLHPRLRVVESWMTDRLHNAASALLNLSYVDAAARTDGMEHSYDRLVKNYNRQQVDAFFDVTRQLTLRGGHRYEWGDSVVRAATLNPSGLPETGEMRRNVGLFGVNYRPSRKLLVNADYEGAAGGSAYFRTSLYDYHRFRGRLRYEILPSLEFSANLSLTDNENPAQGVNYDFRHLLAGGSLRWNPGGSRRISLHGDYAWSSLRSNLLFLDPGRLNAVESFYRDNGHTASAVVDIRPAGSGGPHAPQITAGGAMFLSSGSRPTRYYQPVGRFLVPLHSHLAWYAEWRWYGLSQAFYVYEGFRTHHLLTGLRLTR